MGRIAGLLTGGNLGKIPIADRIHPRRKLGGKKLDRRTRSLSARTLIKNGPPPESQRANCAFREKRHLPTLIRSPIRTEGQAAPYALLSEVTALPAIAAWQRPRRISGGAAGAFPAEDLHQKAPAPSRPDS